jgi:aspartate oxidase
MWERAGLVREAAGLREVLASAAPWERTADAMAPSREVGELRNLLCVGQLVATSAMVRRESRGAHFRSDYPWTDPAQARRIRVSMDRREIHVEGIPNGAGPSARPLLGAVASAGAESRASEGRRR